MVFVIPFLSSEADFVKEIIEELERVRNVIPIEERKDHTLDLSSRISSRKRGQTASGLYELPYFPTANQTKLENSNENESKTITKHMPENLKRITWLEGVTLAGLLIACGSLVSINYRMKYLKIKIKWSMGKVGRACIPVRLQLDMVAGTSNLICSYKSKNGLDFSLFYFYLFFLVWWSRNCKYNFYEIFVSFKIVWNGSHVDIDLLSYVRNLNELVSIYWIRLKEQERKRRSEETRETSQFLQRNSQF